MDYCIVEENDIPEELMAKIEEKKAADLKMVFENDDVSSTVKLNHNLASTLLVYGCTHFVDV